MTASGNVTLFARINYDIVRTLVLFGSVAATAISVAASSLITCVMLRWNNRSMTSIEYIGDGEDAEERADASAASPSGSDEGEEGSEAATAAADSASSDEDTKKTK
jgi:hypothetical protein